MALAEFHDFSTEGEEVNEYRMLIRGDHLAVEGDMNGIEYYHHGIFLGFTEGVADFGGDNKQDAKLRKVDIMEFTKKGQRRLIRIKYPPGQCLSPEKAAKNAEELIANPTKWGSFNLLTNNCEHFASQCKTGIPVSNQVISKIRDAICDAIRADGQSVLAISARIS